MQRRHVVVIGEIWIRLVGKQQLDCFGLTVVRGDVERRHAFVIADVRVGAGLQVTRQRLDIAVHRGIPYRRASHGIGLEARWFLFLGGHNCLLDGFFRELLAAPIATRLVVAGRQHRERRRGVA